MNNLDEMKKRLKRLNSMMAVHKDVEYIKRQIAENDEAFKAAETTVEEMSIELDAAKDRRCEALEQTTDALTEKMNSLLSGGGARIDIDNGKLFIGWKVEDHMVPYLALSGGQKVSFDAALTHALMGKKDGVIILEAGEADDKRLKGIMNKAGKLDCQVIINSWHSPVFPDDWEVVEVK